MKTLCAKCGLNPRRVSHRYCAPCHAEYMRDYRRANGLPESQKAKDAARHIAGVYKRRGLLAPRLCVVCGSASVEMHHDNYDEPLEVTWLCRPCHLSHHKAA